MSELTRRFNEVAATQTPESVDENLQGVFETAAGDFYDSACVDVLDVLDRMVTACVVEHNAQMSLELVKALIDGLRATYQKRKDALDAQQPKAESPAPEATP